MRNAAFVIGALALAVVIIVGYQQLRPVGQRAASGGSAPSANDPTAELARRLLLPGYAPDNANYDLRLYPGTLPPDLKIDLPQPAGARLIGTALRLRNGAPASIDSVMDVAGSADDVSAFFERELGKLGWIPAPNRGPSQGGFVGGPVVNSRMYCNGEKPPWYNVSVFTPAGAPLDVRMHVDLVSPYSSPGSFGPCSANTGPQPMGGMNKLPALRAPTGVAMRPSGGGGGNDRQSSDATAVGTMSATDLEAAFDQQLTAAGWSRVARGADGPIAWSTWKLPGDGDWRGLLLINEVTGDVRSLLLQAQLVN